MNNKRMTTAEIAKKLHLSQPTVSRALNPARAWMVNIRTREKIRNFCLKAGVINSISSIHSKHARAAFVLGDMEADLFHLNKLIGSLTIQLQNSGCSLSLIRVDDTPGKLVCSVKRVLSSDLADIFITSPSFLTAQNPEFLHQVSSRLVLMTPFSGLNDWITSRKWLSGIYYDYESSHRKVILELPDELLTDMVFFGASKAYSEKRIKLLKTQIRDTGRRSRLTGWLFDIIKPASNIVTYRDARIAAYEQFQDYAGHKLYWSAGFTEGVALYDEFRSRGLQQGRDYHLITYGNHQTMKNQTGEELPHFDLCSLDRSSLLCELILEKLENAVPRQIPIPTPFYPAGLPVGKPV